MFDADGVLGLFLQGYRPSGAVNVAPTDIAWAGSHSVAEDAALGTQVGGILTAVDPEAGSVTFSIPDATSKFAIGAGGNVIIVAGVLDFETATSHSVTVRATDDNGATYDENFTVTVTDVSEDAPQDPPPDDDPVVDDEDHFDVLPHSITVDGSVKFAGKKKANGLSAKFMHDFSGEIGPLQAGHEYIFEFTADFSLMSQQGALTAVGLMLKAGNDFYSIGVKGDGGATNLKAYTVDGTNKWNQTSGYTLTDEGTAAHGTQWGPIWLKATVSADGTTVTFATGTDIDTWDDDVVDATLGPFGDVGDVTQWGIGGIFDSTDSGPYSIDVTYWEIVDTRTFLGAQVEKTADQTAADYSAGAAIAWGQAQFDTSGLWSGGSPTKFVVPAALNGKWATFYANVVIDSFTDQHGAALCIRKNGSVDWLGAGGASNLTLNSVEAVATRMMLQAETQKIQLATGDEFDVHLTTYTDNSVTIVAGRSSFGVHVTPDAPDGCLVYLAADAGNLNLNWSTLTGFDSEVYDTHGIHDVATNNGRLTIPVGLNGRKGIFRARLKIGSSGASTVCQIHLLKNGGGVTTWQECGFRTSAMSGLNGSGNQFIEATSQPVTLNTGDYYEIQTRNTDGTSTLVAAYCTFGLEVLPASFEGVLAQRTTLNGQNPSGGITLSWAGTDLYDADAAHDQSGTPTQIIIPAAWDGKKGILDAHVYTESSAHDSPTIQIQRDVGAGPLNAYDGFGGWGGYGTDVAGTFNCARSQIVDLVAGEKWTVKLHTVATNVNLVAASSTFGLRVLNTP